MTDDRTTTITKKDIETTTGEELTLTVQVHEGETYFSIAPGIDVRRIEVIEELVEEIVELDATDVTIPEQ